MITERWRVTFPQWRAARRGEGWTCYVFFFFSSRRRHTRLQGDWSSDVCSSDLVGTFHTTGGRSRLLEWMRGMLQPIVGRLSARIAVSETAHEYAARYFPGEYHVIPNGVDVERFHPRVAPIARWRGPDHDNILFVGRLDSRKGVQLLLDCMPEVVERTNGRARLL